MSSCSSGSASAPGNTPAAFSRELRRTSRVVRGTVPPFTLPPTPRRRSAVAPFAKASLCVSAASAIAAILALGADAAT
eukprot:CAMPEP_0117676964 /NCGR_PEP_ID=MMETSP0804-20121206/16492_1 /TAXON_ID=1074897 /ORGANISM="Tetraselmis astigmatica, Strain CCMP880" /LENGTH=77 /DNA_ID=CAMNT_0005486215 /DNA_START=1344 /DNA_END=1573 /DNA_ORIENTATION=+